MLSIHFWCNLCMIMINMTPMFPLSSASCHLGGDTGSGGALMTCATFISNVQLVWTFSGRTQSGQFGRRHHMMIRGALTQHLILCVTTITSASICVGTCGHTIHTYTDLHIAILSLDKTALWWLHIHQPYSPYINYNAMLICWIDSRHRQPLMVF